MDSGSRLYAYLSYGDAPAALRWLEAVGFTVVRRQDGPEQTVQHAEVRFGDVVLMLASADAPYVQPPLIGQSTGDGLYLWLPEPAEVDAWYGRALAAGAQAVVPPEDTAWGTRRARVLDPQGKEWSSGSYQPGLTW